MNAVIPFRLHPPAGDTAALCNRLEYKYADRITGALVVPAHPGRHVPLPADLPDELAAALRPRGIRQLYSHQTEAWNAAARGDNLVVVTPTASGKSLCYTLPVVASAMHELAKALYLFPTKAPAQDQVADLIELSRPGRLAFAQRLSMGTHQGTSAKRSG